MLIVKRIMIVLFSLFCGAVSSIFVDTFLTAMLLTKMEVEFFNTCIPCDLYYYSFSIVIFWFVTITTALSFKWK